MKKELILRSKEISLPIESIYFGGGSPSLLRPKEIEDLIQLIKLHFKLKQRFEVTLEINPDDVTSAYLSGLKKAGINTTIFSTASKSRAQIEVFVKGVEAHLTTTEVR